MSGEIRTGNETTQVRWVERSDLAQYDIHPTMRLRIEHAMDRTRATPHIG